MRSAAKEVPWGRRAGNIDRLDGRLNYGRVISMYVQYRTMLRRPLSIVIIIHHNNAQSAMGKEGAIRTDGQRLIINTTNSVPVPDSVPVLYAGETRTKNANPRKERSIRTPAIR